MTDLVVVGTAFKLIARLARLQRNRLPWAGFELAALSRGLYSRLCFRVVRVVPTYLGTLSGRRNVTR